jgi:hypothetical protein
MLTMFLLVTNKQSISALRHQRLLQHGSYHTSTRWLREMRRAMGVSLSKRDKLGPIVEVDETLIGGKDIGGKSGLGSAKKMKVVGAVESIGGRCGRARFQVISGRTTDEIASFLNAAVADGSVIKSDWANAYLNVAGSAVDRFHIDFRVVSDDTQEQKEYKARKQRGEKDATKKVAEHLPNFHRVASLIKRVGISAHQGACRRRHLQLYLDEYCFRFDGRNRSQLFGLVGDLARASVRTQSVPYWRSCGRVAQTNLLIDSPKHFASSPQMVASVGSARFRSWSFSRENMFRTCPRQYFYEYFPHGEENATVLGFLKNTTTLALLVGTITHDMVGNALRLYKARRIVKNNLRDAALVLFDDAVGASASAAEKVREGNSVRIGRRVLLEHLAGPPNRVSEALARESLLSYLEAIENSSAWKFLRTTDTSKWKDVASGTDPKESVEASLKIGFQSGFSLRVYTAFDLAFRHEGEFIIVDWKTGVKSSRAIASARRQTTGYSLWALKRSVPLERVRLQPFWLRSGEKWEPTPVSVEELDDVQRSIETHDAIERKVLREERDGKSNVIYHARLDDFPPRPSRACGSCKYRTVCSEGRAHDASA